MLPNNGVSGDVGANAPPRLNPSVGHHQNHDLAPTKLDASPHRSAGENFSTPGATGNEIPGFVLQKIVDFHFLITTLTRLRKMADLVAKFSNISEAIKKFDETLPDRLPFSSQYRKVASS